jgi:hypothetical protein
MNSTPGTRRRPGSSRRSLGGTRRGGGFLLLTAEKKFWRCVETGEAPHLFGVERSAWDVGELKAEFEELIIADAPIEISGFGSDEIDEIVSGGDKGGSEAADFAPPPGACAISRVGDLFLLGRHRVICGNAADPDGINRLMGTDIARMVLTDAPFPIAIERHGTASDQREDGTVSEVMTNAQLAEFNRDWMNAVLAM